MKNWIKYGLTNALLGLVIGIFISVESIGNGYYVFAIVAPIAAFLTGGIAWKMIMKNCFDHGKIYITGITTGIVSHYITFILINIGMNICYWTTGNCTGSLGSPPANILLMLFGAFGLTFFSLLFYGWITVPYSILMGFILKRINEKKNAA